MEAEVSILQTPEFFCYSLGVSVSEYKSCGTSVDLISLNIEKDLILNYKIIIREPRL